MRWSVFERGWWTGEGRCLGPTVVGRQGSEVTDGQESKVGVSESMGDSNSASQLGSESELRPSFRCFFHDMGIMGEANRKEGIKT